MKEARNQRTAISTLPSLGHQTQTSDFTQVHRQQIRTDSSVKHWVGRVNPILLVCVVTIGFLFHLLPNRSTTFEVSLTFFSTLLAEIVLALVLFFLLATLLRVVDRKRYEEIPMMVSRDMRLAIFILVAVFIVVSGWSDPLYQHLGPVAMFVLAFSLAANMWAEAGHSVSLEMKTSDHRTRTVMVKEDYPYPFCSVSKTSWVTLEENKGLTVLIKQHSYRPKKITSEVRNKFVDLLELRTSQEEKKTQPDQEEGWKSVYTLMLWLGYTQSGQPNAHGFARALDLPKMEEVLAVMTDYGIHTEVIVPEKSEGV